LNRTHKCELSPYTALFRSKSIALMHLATVILSSKEQAEALSAELEEVVSTGWFHNKDTNTWTLEVLFEEYHHDLVRAVLNNPVIDRKSTRLNSSHVKISYA